MSNVRDQRRRAVGAPLADRNPWVPLAVPASGVTTRDDHCIALLGFTPYRVGSDSWQGGPPCEFANQGRWRANALPPQAGGEGK
jgi:hypothetical protein